MTSLCAQLRSKHSIFFVGAVSGLLMAFVLEAIYVGQYTLIARILATLLAGALAGLALTHEIKKAYTVAVVACLYVYAISFLLSAMQLIHFAIYALLLSLASVGLFYLSNKYFISQSFRLKKKTMLAIGVWLLFYIMCALINVYISRLVALSYLTA